MAPHPDRTRPQALASWLLAVAALVVLMVVVGGVTRLTESGLSITRWEPVAGALPPLSDSAWEEQFALYRQTPEYRLEAGPAGMDLAAFKRIFFWEWAHRLLGRIIGLAFALPFAWFWAKKAIPAGYAPRLLALLALGGLQGAFGWLMVRSGLGGAMTDVSHFWLSIHLMTAFFTLAGLVWTALDLRALAADPAAGPARLRLPAAALALVVAFQLLLGAWVAGLNAGHASDSWPLMQGRLVPEFADGRGLLWAASHDPFLVHFLHRWWAFAALAAVIVLARHARPVVPAAAKALNALAGVQILLGIATVLSGVALFLAAIHQLVGALLVMAVAWGCHAVGRRTASRPGEGAAV